MKVIWDFHELFEFADRLQDTHDLDTALMTATQNVARVLHSYLLVNTPVDTGNLRKMWSAGDNLKFTVTPVGNGFEVVLINDATNKRGVDDSEIRSEGNGFKYGRAVNDGHKTPSGGWVMGRFFVEKSIVQTLNSTKFEKLIMTELSKWFEVCVNG